MSRLWLIGIVIIFFSLRVGGKLFQYWQFGGKEGSVFDFCESMYLDDAQDIADEGNLNCHHHGSIVHCLSKHLNVYMESGKTNLKLEFLLGSLFHLILVPIFVYRNILSNQLDSEPINSSEELCGSLVQKLFLSPFVIINMVMGMGLNLLKIYPLSYGVIGPIHIPELFPGCPHVIHLPFL